MRRELVAILVCPRCRGDVTLGEVREERGGRVVSGTLVCTACARRYPVAAGVPRLLEAESAVGETGRRFDYQWQSRWQGLFEGKGRCYGFDHDDYVGWMRDQLVKQRPLAAGERLLDAGCGSGEKSAALARLCPGQQVVGMDLGIGALERAAAEFAVLPNLDFVQGNILSPPLRPQTFAWGISIGMLHHTPDTRQALAQFRGLLRDDAALLLWIYPTFREGPEWRLLYLTRDVLLLGLGPELPSPLLRFLSFCLIAGIAPIAYLGWRQEGERLRKSLPFFNPDGMSMGEQFGALTFHLFDTLHPRFQFRHSRREIERWLTEEGCTPAFHAHGYYVAGAAQQARTD